MKYSIDHLSLVILAVVLSSCAVHEAPTHFYSLNATIPTEQHQVQQTFKVGVGPLNFPKFLQRPQVITRKNNNQINVADFHQWGGRLDEEFLRILSDDLVSLLASSEIYSYPWESRLRPDYQVRINVSRFDGKLGDSVNLRARWQLLSRNRHTAPISVQSNIIEPVNGSKYTDYVAAQSRALGKLAREIAEKIKASVMGRNTTEQPARP
ncbi:MAG TPA: membrane integrity-associated transporter subunit PqiC [Gammaproteobacteria bacterium]|nr:membrane integrity-associated transporter subunit PqiC [Gammaproteobacteria bacterium]